MLKRRTLHVHVRTRVQGLLRISLGDKFGLRLVLQRERVQRAHADTAYAHPTLTWTRAITRTRAGTGVGSVQPGQLQ